MAFVVLYDANVLYPSTLRDLLIRIAQAGLVQANWTDCLVTGHEALIDAVELPDPDDRHVLAAAIKARAQVIVTNNLKDFPPTALEPGTSRRSQPTTSFSTRSTSIAMRSTAPSSGPPTPASIRPRPSPTCSPCSNATASSNRQPPFAPLGVDG